LYRRHRRRFAEPIAKPPAVRRRFCNRRLSRTRPPAVYRRCGIRPNISLGCKHITQKVHTHTHTQTHTHTDIHTHHVDARIAHTHTRTFDVQRSLQRSPLQTLSKKKRHAKGRPHKPRQKTGPKPPLYRPRPTPPYSPLTWIFHNLDIFISFLPGYLNLQSVSLTRVCSDT
jgi:hypothetical protein